MTENENVTVAANSEEPSKVSADAQEDAASLPVVTEEPVAKPTAPPSVSPIPVPNPYLLRIDLRSSANTLLDRFNDLQRSFGEALKSFEGLLLLTPDELQKARTFVKHLSRKNSIANMAIESVRQARDEMYSGDLPVEAFCDQLLEAESLASDVAGQVMRLWVALSEFPRHAPTVRKCRTRVQDISPLLPKNVITTTYYGGVIWEDPTP